MKKDEKSSNKAYQFEIGNLIVSLILISAN